MSAETCIENIAHKLAAMVGIEELPKEKFKTPASGNYSPELDESKLCTLLEASKYQSLVGSAYCIVAQGRLDIAYSTSSMARYSIAP